MSDGRRGVSDLEARRNAGTCLAMFGLLLVGAGLFALAVFIMPDLLKALLFGAFIIGFIVLHYLTWGRWLSRPRPGDLAEDESSQAGDLRVDSDEYADD